MNEQELRDGLHEAMVASSPPPSMNPNAALDAARRAHKRRRATWAGASAGLAVAALAAGSVFAFTGGTGGGEPLPIDPANSASAVNPDQASKTQWPDGQPDRTARTGPQAAKGETLLTALKAALPDTLVVNTTAKHASGNPVTASQSQFEDYVNNDKTKQIWEHLATAAVNSKAAPNAGTGRVIVEVVTPGGKGPADLCDIATKQFWGIGGTCAVQQVQGKQVGVVTKSDDSRIDQAAAYRYDDGTTVVVAQSKEPVNETATGKGMAQLPLTVDQLATLAINPAFKIS